MALAATFPGTFPGALDGLLLAPGTPPGPGPAPIIAGPPAPGAGWEIKVLSYKDYSTVLALLPAKMITSYSFVRQLSDLGSGSVQLNLDDPWWTLATLADGTDTDEILDFECLWQVTQDGAPRFEFLGETVQEQLVDPSEQRLVTVTGPGTMATLKWAMAAPQGFPDIINKLDSIADQFDEVDVNGHPVLDTNIWTVLSPAASIFITPVTPLYNNPGGPGIQVSTLYPSGTLTLQATTSPTVLGATYYDATDTLVSAQISPVGAQNIPTDSNGNPDPYGTNLNGSELTQFYVQSAANPNYFALIGLSGSSFYAEEAGPDGTQTHVISTTASFDTSNDAYWMITEQGGSAGGPGTFYFWTSADGQNWKLQWQCVHTWDARKCGFYISASYNGTGQSAIVSALNSNVSTPSYQGNIYLGLPGMGIWWDLLTTAQARGTIPFVTTALTQSADSFGRAWPDTQNVQVNNGTDLFALLQGFAAVVNADYVMNPGFQLVVGQPEQNQVAIGADRTGSIVFREAQDEQAKQRTRARNQIANLVGGENSDGHETSATDATSIAQWGQREAWFQTSAQVDPTSMAIAVQAAAEDNADEILSWTLTIPPNRPGRTVFANFDVGDWVGLERPDLSGIDSVRVVGIAVSVDNTGLETHELTVQSYLQWVEQQLTYIANKLGGSFVNTPGTTPVAPSRYGSGQVPTYFTPAQSLASLADVVGTAGSNGAPLVYNAATGKWQPAGTANPATGQPTGVTVPSPTGSTTITGGQVTTSAAPGMGTAPDGGGAPAAAARTVTSPTVTQIYDATGTVRTIVGAQADGTFTTSDVNGGPPSTPDAPSVTGTFNGLFVTWDGKLAGAAPLSDFLWAEVHLSTASGFTPSTATLTGTMQAAGTFPVTGLQIGTTYYVKLLARNTSGAASGATAQVSGVPTALTASLVGTGLGTLNANPYFIGGDGTGWAGVNGILSVSTAPPAGAPLKDAGYFTITTAGVGAAAKESGAPFAAAAGTQYLFTAWVYTATTAAVIGFDWLNSASTLLSTSTQSFTVTANTWTLVTGVFTSPTNTALAVPRVAPADGAGNYIYFTSAIALPQVPGSLIQAGTITATQIAAATITAATIASGTITSTQIAAGTITGANIAAGTITGGLIAAGTITASNISAGTITAGLLAAGIVYAGIVNGTTITGASIVADGSSGEVLVYSGTPASGNLIGSWSGASGTDASGNSYPLGLMAQGLVLPAQASGPAAVTGASTLYSSTAGRLRFLSSVGADTCLDRSVVNVSQFTQGNSTSPAVIGAALTYYAGEASQSSEFEIEIDGNATVASSGLQVLNFALYVDGSQLGAQVGLGATFQVAGKTYAYTIRFRLTITASGAGGTCTTIADGGCMQSGANAGNAGVDANFNAVGVGHSFDTTSGHTLQPYAWWSAVSNGQTLTTYRTRLTRRN